eukprot:1405777-Amphidinium_carterae.1
MSCPCQKHFVKLEMLHGGFIWIAIAPVSVEEDIRQSLLNITQTRKNGHARDLVSNTKLVEMLE